MKDWEPRRKPRYIKYIYLVQRVLGKKSRKEVGPRKSENLIHVFGKRKEIRPRKSENLKISFKNSFTPLKI